MTTAARTPHAPPQPVPVPAGTRLILDHDVRRYAAGRVLLGGSPLRVLTLSATGAKLLDGWIAGDAVTESRRDGLLARRLLDAGLVHPAPSPRPSPRPEVTLVVPVKDNPDGLARLLDATRDLPARIVVDDGSSAPLLQASVRHRTPAGPAAARNTGWRLARTELVAFLDSDTLPEPGWLDTILPLFADPQVVAAAPRVRGLLHDDDLSHQATRGRHIARYEADRSCLDLGPNPATVRPTGRVSYVPSAALVIRRSALTDVGGFDETLRFGEDVDLIWRLVNAGGTVRYQPDSVVWHQPRRTLRSWLRQRFDYGTSAAPLAQRHPGQLSCARLSPYSAAAWAMAAAGHPVLGVAVAAISTGMLPRRLHHHGIPTRASLGLAARGHLAAGRQLAEATRRTWWPLALLTTRGRLLLAASLLPCLAEAITHRRGARWTALRVADDLSYGAGVWAGCLRHHTLEPLHPQLTSWPGRRP